MRVWLDAGRHRSGWRRRGVGLSHNPESNMKLASGTAAVPAWLAAGVAAGLGTDGAASNNDLDMFEAMRVAALLHKLTSNNPETLPAGQVLELATRGAAPRPRPGGSHRQPRAGQAGRCDYGERHRRAADADVRPGVAPGLRRRGVDVRTTIVAGRVLMREGRVRSLDRELRAAATRARRQRACARRWGSSVARVDEDTIDDGADRRRGDSDAGAGAGAGTMRARYDPADAPVHFIAVLKGAFMFLADLIRAMEGPVTCDFIAVSSYGSGTSSSGEVRLLKDLDRSIEGRDVVIVEDIVDTGLTLSYLQEILRAREPRSLATACLLSKPSRRKVDVRVEHIGFTIDDRFVVGYGLDFDERHRNLPYIGVLESS